MNAHIRKYKEQIDKLKSIQPKKEVKIITNEEKLEKYYFLLENVTNEQDKQEIENFIHNFKKQNKLK